MVDKESFASDRQFIAQKSIETYDLQIRENKYFQNIENKEMKNKAIDNGTTRKLNQPTENADEKKRLLITASNDTDREKGRDYTFISLLLDNAHETDILWIKL